MVKLTAAFMILVAIAIVTFGTIIRLDNRKNAVEVVTESLISCQEERDQLSTQLKSCQDKPKPTCLMTEDMDMYCTVQEASRVHNDSH